MRLGLRTALLLTIGSALTGCLTSNPNLTDSGGSEGDGGTAATDPSVGPTSGPATGVGPTSGPTTTGDPTTDGPTTIGPDTTDTDPTDPTSDTDETTGPAACGGGNVCVEAAPAGWAGPVVWAETLTTDEAPECPAAYPDLAFEAFDDLQAAPAECDCDCGSASGASCAAITLEYHGTQDCDASPAAEFSIPVSGSCQPGPADLPSGRNFIVAEPGLVGGSCTASGSSTVSDPVWADSVSVCAGNDTAEGVCPDQLECVAGPPREFESLVCVWQAGDLDCPSGQYSERYVRYSDFDDSRDCATCTCGNPTGNCSGNVRLWPTSNCSGGFGSGTVPLGGDCVESSDDADSADVGTVTVANAACEPSVGTAVGDASPSQPSTLCCVATG